MSLRRGVYIIVMYLAMVASSAWSASFTACGVDFHDPWFAIPALGVGGTGTSSGYMFVVDSSGNVLLGASTVQLGVTAISFLSHAFLIYSNPLSALVFALDGSNLLMRGHIYDQQETIPTSQGLVFWGPSGPVAAITSQGDLYSKGFAVYSGAAANCSDKICPDGTFSVCHNASYCACYYGGSYCQVLCEKLCGESNESGCIPAKNSSGQYYTCSDMIWPFISADFGTGGSDSDGDGLPELGGTNGTAEFPYYAESSTMGWSVTAYKVNCDSGSKSSGSYVIDYTHGIGFKDGYYPYYCVEGHVNYSVWVGKATTVQICVQHGFYESGGSYVEPCKLGIYVDGSWEGGYSSTSCYENKTSCTSSVTLSPGTHTIEVVISAEGWSSSAIANGVIAWVKEVDVSGLSDRLVYRQAGTSGCTMYQLYEIT